MKTKLWILCGPPASGKSTWVKENMGEYDIWISRDKVRFSMVDEKEDYFSREKEVFNEFIRQIAEAINSNKYDNIYVDATHINENARNKVLNRLPVDKVSLNSICFECSEKELIRRNAERPGRACVPETAILNMLNNYEKTDPIREKYKYDMVKYIIEGV